MHLKRDLIFTKNSYNPLKLAKRIAFSHIRCILDLIKWTNCPYYRKDVQHQLLGIQHKRPTIHHSGKYVEELKCSDIDDGNVKSYIYFRIEFDSSLEIMHIHINNNWNYQWLFSSFLVLEIRILSIFSH